MLTSNEFKFLLRSRNRRCTQTIFVYCETTQSYVNVCQFRIFTVQVFVNCMSLQIGRFKCDHVSYTVRVSTSILVFSNPSSSSNCTWHGRKIRGYRRQETGDVRCVRGLSGELKGTAGPQSPRSPGTVGVLTDDLFPRTVYVVPGVMKAIAGPSSH